MGPRFIAKECKEYLRISSYKARTDLTVFSVRGGRKPECFRSIITGKCIRLTRRIAFLCR